MDTHGRVKVPAYLVKINSAWPEAMNRHRLREVASGPTPFRLLITGSRDAEHDVWIEPIAAVLRLVRVRLLADPSHQDATLVHGAARGIDRWAANVGATLGFRIEPHRVKANEWEVRRDAGHARNRRMLNSGIDLVVGFVAAERSNGTRGCLEYARGMHLPTVRITYEDLIMPHVELGAPASV